MLCVYPQAIAARVPDQAIRSRLGHEMSRVLKAERHPAFAVRFGKNKLLPRRRRLGTTARGDGCRARACVVRTSRHATIRVWDSAIARRDLV